jgi:hypothetical protein
LEIHEFLFTQPSDLLLKKCFIFLYKNINDPIEMVIKNIILISIGSTIENPKVKAAIKNNINIFLLMNSLNFQFSSL